MSKKQNILANSTLTCKNILKTHTDSADHDYINVGEKRAFCHF